MELQPAGTTKSLDATHALGITHTSRVRDFCTKHDAVKNSMKSKLKKENEETDKMMFDIWDGLQI